MVAGVSPAAEDGCLAQKSRLEEALRDFDLVAGPELHILRRIFAKSPHVVNGYFISAQKPDVSLIREIIETAGCVDCGEKRHVFSERDA